MAADENDFAEFYHARFGHLVAQLFAVTGDLSEAQDCAQEAFVRAWPRWSKICQYDNPSAWLYRVGYRIAVSRWRRLKRVIGDHHHDPPDNVEPGPESVALVTALRQLPEAQRRALVLHHMVGRTVAQISEDEGVALGTVKARLSRGRIALAALLRDDEEPAVEHTTNGVSHA